MINPHGSTELNPLYVRDDARRAELQAEAEQLPSLLLNSAAAANAVMLGAGYFNPLTGFMSVADAVSVAENLTTEDGVFWPVPIVNLTSDETVTAGNRIALRDPNVDGHPVLAIMDVQSVESVERAQLEAIAEKVFRTLDSSHPGVATFLGLGNRMLSGPIEVLNFSYFASDFPATFRTAYEIRDAIAALGWNKVVAFQTRNPMHRAHEELCRMAMQELSADGILIHMLLGKLKPGDIPADVRDAAIRKMVEVYFPADTVLITGYGFDMLYAGPREAVLHAVFRQNCGCTH
ncbi:MAG: sulfate adenylyltransferase, partial [Pseudomonadota bacterium]